jgi:hypothetical protein
MTRPKPIYIIDAYCARRLLELTEQLHATIEEMLRHRRHDPPDPLHDLEALDLAALLANTRAEEEDELF